jgi:DNA-binding IclR family transcriptional regulator
VAGEVERIVREHPNRMQQLAETELHLRAARDPELRDASKRCFEAYEQVAEAGLEKLGVPGADRHARTIVALMYGLALRRLGTGDEDPTGLAEALVTIGRGASR